MSLAELIAATESTNNNTRNEAERKLVEARDQNTEMFILACSEEFSQNNLSDSLRPKAAILIKYTLLNSEGGAEKLWYNLDSQVREKTKTNLLMTLASKSDIIRNVAGDLISIIFSCEVGKGHWNDLIENLANNTGHEDAEIKKSAIMALGHICEKLKDRNVFTSQTTEQILMGICYGLDAKERDDIRIISLTALRNSFSFIREQMEKQNIRKFVVEKLLESANSNNKKLLIAALQTLIEYVKFYYESIQEFLKDLWDTLKNYLSHSDKEIVVPAIEIWNTISVEDKERAAGIQDGKNMAFGRKSCDFMHEVAQGLIPILLENLLNQDKYEDDGNFNIVESTKTCLASIAEAIKDKYLDYVTDFIGCNIMVDSSLEITAALIAYWTMLDGPSHQKLSDFVSKALPQITQYLNNHSQFIVRKSAAAALERTAEITPLMYFQDPLFYNILPELIKGIGSSPEISLHVTKLWHYIGEELAKKDNKELDLSEPINNLIKNAFRKDLEDGFNMLIDNSLLAAMTLLHATQKEDIKAKYVPILVEEFKNTGNVSTERREWIQSGLLACLQTLLHGYQVRDNGKIIDEIYNLVFQMFDALGATADGIHVLGALAATLEADFRQYSEKVWPIVARGIQQTEEQELFNASLSALTELSRACPEETANYLGDIFDHLIKLLNKDGFEKTMKLSIIITIGDISLGCKSLIGPHVNDLLGVYEMGMNAAVIDPKESAPDMVDYLESLRENLLESFICFFYAVGEEPNCQERILNFIPGVMLYLEKTCTQEYNPTVEYMRNALALIADIGSAFKNKVRNYVESKLTETLVKVLQKFNNNSENETIIEYTKKVISEMDM